ncbi:MAG: chitobiase/beta-hexosaminidase C-terminal domain-containing protein [Verrucomicrobiales bacterium]
MIQEFAPAFPPQSTGIAYGISDANSATGFLAPPTPGQPNLTDAYDGVLKKKVDFATPGGLVFDASISVALTHEDPEATIRYTMDGSIPTAASPRLHGAAAGAGGHRIGQGGAFRDGYVPGPLSQESYLFADAEIAAASAAICRSSSSIRSTRRCPAMTASSKTLFAGQPELGRRHRAHDADRRAERGRQPGIHVRGESRRSPASTNSTFRSRPATPRARTKTCRSSASPPIPTGRCTPRRSTAPSSASGCRIICSMKSGAIRRATDRSKSSSTKAAGKITAADYRGLYLLIERVKRSSDRVDVAKLDPLEKHRRERDWRATSSKRIYGRRRCERDHRKLPTAR